MKKLIFGLMFFNFAQAAQQQQAQAPAQQAAFQDEPSYQEQAREQIMQAIPLMPAVLANLISQYADTTRYVAMLKELKKLPITLPELQTIERLFGRSLNFVNLYSKLLQNLILGKKGSLNETYRRLTGRITNSDKDINRARLFLETESPQEVIKVLTNDPHYPGSKIPPEIDDFEPLYYFLKAFAKLEKNIQVQQMMQELMGFVDEDKDQVFAAYAALNVPKALLVQDKLEDKINNAFKYELSPNILEISKDHVGEAVIKQIEQNIRQQLDSLKDLVKTSAQMQLEKESNESKIAKEQFERAKNQLKMLIDPLLLILKDSGYSNYGVTVRDLNAKLNPQAQAQPARRR